MRLRIATFNLENFDEANHRNDVALEERIWLMRPQLVRLDADVLCLQEVHGQERAEQPRALLALDELLERTVYAGFYRASTRLKSEPESVYDVRNLVILSRFEITEQRQLKDERFAPHYGFVTTDKPQEPKPIRWERPILHAILAVENRRLHVLNVHLKSKRPVNVPDREPEDFAYPSAAVWAEGSFVSAMKRLGQAVELRALIDEIFEEEPDALIALTGDFNEQADEPAMRALRGEVEDHNNAALAYKTLALAAMSVSKDRRYSLIHHGQGEMIDHILVSRALLAHYRHTEIHNELLHDESRAFATDAKYPESDHAPVVAHFELG